MLKDVYYQLLSQYTPDADFAARLWQEIALAHSAKGRHYHTLTHLEHLYHELEAVRESIADWDTLLFTLFYHDFVYNTLRQDNEEESARVATELLTMLGVPEKNVARCVGQILATKQHQFSADPDTNLFTDADLSILGAPWERYSAYAAEIRREYSIYPDLLYKPGRRKVLQHFLAMDSIYKTPHFKEQYEQQARRNLQQELTALG